jgi:hypothetical protein
MHLLPAPLIESVMARHPGKYSGHVEEWAEWRRRWMPFLREVKNAWPSITNAQRLALLRSALDDAGVMLLDARLEVHPEETYEEYFAGIDLDLGGEDKAALRKKMARLTLPQATRLTEKAWRDYWAKLSTLAAQVGADDEEVGRLGVEALPQSFQRRVATEEDKRADSQAVLLEGIPTDVTVEEVEAMVVAETQRRPRAVRRVGKKMRVVTQDEAHRTQVKALYDRQRLAGG